jgi:OmpA-OmpF porin, OOP family
MNIRRTFVPRGIAILALAAFLSTPSAPASAGLTDALKKKIGDKATKKAEDAIDKAAEGKKPAAEEANAAPTQSAGEPAAAESAPPDAKVSTVSTKFDFVPGDKVMLLDDFTQDELGEFPAKFSLKIGTFEVAEMEKERWLRCMSDDGTVRLKLPAASLPEFWTLEFDFYSDEATEGALYVSGMSEQDHTIWSAAFPSAKGLHFRSGEVMSSTPVEGDLAGRHHVMLMGRGKAIKAYVDRQRLANVPEIDGRWGPVKAIDIRLWSATHPMITNVRFAEGCRPAKDLLAEGKLVTYGIHFATGSDVVLPESAPVLRQVASYLEANPAVKLRIVGHTDNVGTAPSNLDLSKRRAASVAKVLAEQFAIPADRLSTDGKGDAEAMSSNAKPEGRAMNRRVEFAKL